MIKKFLMFILKPRAWLALLFLIALGAVLFYLGFHHHLEPIKAFLDSDKFSFTIGKTRFSIYMVLETLVIIIVLFWIAIISAELCTNKVQKLKRVNASNRALIIKALQIVIFFVALLIALNFLQIDLTGLAIFSGAIGIGVGFGLQKITSNFISGIILLFEKSIEEGDLVELGDGTTGFVKHTGARYTLIETFECREIMVPNEDFITHRVTNWTYSNNQGRIEINIGISYGSNLDKAYEIILEAAREQPRCSVNPAPECYLIDFGDSSVNYKLFFWVDNIVEGRKRPRSDVLLSIWRKFHQHGIEIPFPQRDVHIKNTEVVG